MADKSTSDKENRKWHRMRFKKNKVWVAVDDKEQPIVKNGKYLIKYQLAQDYEYWVNPSSIRALDDPQNDDQAPPGKKPQPKKKPSGDMMSGTQDATNSDAVRVYTDGASSGNPGPSGIGVLLRYGDHEKEISRFIGNTTNNVAELEAIRVGLLELKTKDLPVRIFTDSEYAYGVLTRGWKARKNQQLIQSIKNLISGFKDIKLIKVRGHVGHEGNERADSLATSAIKNRGV